VKSVPLIRFGSYLLVKKIAVGGMADVYYARVTGMRGFSRSVAIKKIHPHLLRQRNFLNMFIDEAKIVSKLLHPNIVQIYELGQVGGQPFIAMEYVPGRDLYELLQRLNRLSEPCPWPLAVRVVLDVAKALHHAHEFKGADGRNLGIVHRDVSPRNILLSYAGDVKLTDFGVARARDREELTQAGIIKGKIRYLSPEAARGMKVDRRSDVFSLGIVFSELLTMEAFRKGRSNLEILAGIRKGVDGSRQFDAMPGELIRVLSKALATDPDERYPSALAFHDDLSSVAVGPIAPMSRTEAGAFLSSIFAKEIEEARHREQKVEEVLRNWKDHSPPVNRAPRSPGRKMPGRPRERATFFGSLRDFSPARLLARMLADEKTGCLELLREPVEKSIFFGHGQILDVTSNIRFELFGEFLVSRKAISRDQLEDALGKCEAENIGLTDYLLKEKILSPGEIFEKLSEQLHGRVLDIFGWPDGEFFFFPEDVPEGVEQKLCLDTPNLIQLGVLEYVPPFIIRRDLGDINRSRASLVHQPGRLHFALAGRMQAVLSALENGPLPVADLQAGEGEEAFSRVLYLLRELGLIRLDPVGRA